MDDAASADMRNYVSRLWAEDWDCPEDAAYDTAPLLVDPREEAKK